MSHLMHMLANAPPFYPYTGNNASASFRHPSMAVIALVERWPNTRRTIVFTDEDWGSL